MSRFKVYISVPIRRFIGGILVRQYKVKRKLQEQSGSYFVALPKIWIESLGLKQGDFVIVSFNGEVRIKPLLEKQRSDGHE